MDDTLYKQKQDEWKREFESLCLRCGECCGLSGDPCENLVKTQEGKYDCSVYEKRLGTQKTVSGKTFTCVPIQEVIKKGMPNRSCGYVVSKFLSILFAILIFCPAVFAEEPKLIPLEVLFGNPTKANPNISPNGNMLAYVAPVDGVLNVWIKTIGKTDDHPITGDKNRGIHFYFWAKDGKSVFYLQDKGGDENWRLYRVDLGTKNVSDLTPFPNMQAQVVEYNKFFPAEMLIAMNKTNPQAHDLYRLDTVSGKFSLIKKNPGNISEWLTDSNLKLRGSLVTRPDGGTDLFLGGNSSENREEWRKFISWNFEDSRNSGPLCFTKDGKYLYIVDSRKSNTARLKKIDLMSGKVKVIAKDRQYDINDVMVDPNTYEIQAVSFLRDREYWMILDKSIKDDFRALKKIAPGDFTVVSRNNANNKWVVAFSSDDEPVAFYCYDRLTKKAEFLFHNRPELKKYKLAKMLPFSFTARDGLTIHGYTTYPQDKPKVKLPVVLLVHGGPEARDAWGYDGTAQWLANRGYACVQVNYRGSSGYGKNFVNAGNREWGAKMHDDLVDTVNFLVRRGIADPKRIAIFGASYGGYAALVGASFTPDLFRCAVDICGPSNLMTLLRSLPPQWTTDRYSFYKMVGNPDTDEEFLKSRSPLFKVQNIKIPILIVQGANDVRVKPQESEQIVGEMKRRGIEYEYMLFPDEGHGLVKPENALKAARAAEQFLSKYLGGRKE